MKKSTSDTADFQTHIVATVRRQLDRNALSDLEIRVGEKPNVRETLQTSWKLKRVFSNVYLINYGELRLLINEK